MRGHQDPVGKVEKEQSLPPMLRLPRSSHGGLLSHTG